jgi:hypothetical protein
MRIADNPKIWGRKPSPEDRPEDRPKHDFSHGDYMGWCKSCGISAFLAYWEGASECPGESLSQASLDQVLRNQDGENQAQGPSAMACEHGIKYEQLLNGYMVMCQQCYEQHGLFKGRTVPMEEWANNVGNDPPKG